MVHSLPRNENNQRPVYNVSVTYKDDFNNQYNDEYICDLNLTDGLTFIVDKNLKDVVNEIKDISKSINDLNKGVNKITNSIESLKNCNRDSPAV
jgi:hypothetical protein